MYAEVDCPEAQSKLQELLRSVERGERYTITLRGKPIADLVPTNGATRPGKAAAVQSMSQIHKVKGVPNSMITAMRRAGGTVFGDSSA